MKLNRRPLLAALLALPLLAACAGPSAPSVPTSGHAATVAQPEQSAHVTTIDVGQGQQTGASFSMAIDMTDGSGAYQLLASSSGERNRVAADITSFDVYLIDHDTALNGAPTGEMASSVAYGPFNVTASLVAGAQTIVFSNVTSSTRDYYVVVKAKDLSGNITNLQSGQTISGDNVYVSTTGGGGAGQVAVGAAPSYTVSSTTQLGVSLKLLDALGARLDSQVTVTDGSTAPVDAVTAN